MFIRYVVIRFLWDIPRVQQSAYSSIGRIRVTLAYTTTTTTTYICIIKMKQGAFVRKGVIGVLFQR